MVKESHKEIYGHVVSLDNLIDEKCLWDFVTGIKSSTENRMLIYLVTMRDENDIREIPNVNLFTSGDKAIFAFANIFFDTHPKGS